jgi:hypothetical protein
MMCVGIPVVKKCELRPGIGLCDDCGEPRWPQEYMGYGMMICTDCIEKDKAFYVPPKKHELKSIKQRTSIRT